MNQSGQVEASSNNQNGPTQNVADPGNPYCRMRQRPEPIEPSREDEVNRLDDDDLAGEKGGDDEIGIGGKRRLAFVGFLSLVLVSVAAFVYLKFGRATQIEHQVAAKSKSKPSSLLGAAAPSLEDSMDQQTKAAIDQAKASRRAGDPQGDGAAPNGPVVEPTPANLPRLALPPDYMEPRVERNSGAGAAMGEQGRAPERTAGQPRHGVSSLYADNRMERSQPPAIAAPASTPPQSRPNPTMVMGRPIKPATLPAFGTMLPVRTLGGVFTLRNSLARLELTREMTGDGWSLKKGTVLIAQQQGGEYNRVYLNVTGFIDPATNRFVRVSGDLLGADGAPGLKGKRRQVGSRWAKAFNRFLQIAPGLGQAALGRNGGTTVIVPTGGASDLLGAGSYDLSRREFIEVEAGSAGYVMITDLPESMKSRDADPADFLAEGSRAEELSEAEMAHLLSDGTPEQIRAAMPRMRPEMRQIAEMVIGKSEK
jgi:hypothetical protein